MEKIKEDLSKKVRNDLNDKLKAAMAQQKQIMQQKTTILSSPEKTKSGSGKKGGA